MPDYTVKADVDSMLRADNDAGIRSAIGLGQTDAPTFLAQTLTGNGSNTSPSLKVGAGAYINGWYSFNGLQLNGVVNSINAFGITTAGTNISNGHLSFGSGNLKLEQDADNILAQRNGTAAQAFRVYNAFLGTSSSEWGEMNWNATANVLRIGTAHGGTGAARPIDFVVGGTARMSLSAASDLTVVGSIFTGSGLAFTSKGYIGMSSVGIMALYNILGNDFNRLQLGGTTSAFPAIKRNGTGIDIRLADDSAFAPLTAGSITAGGTLSVGGSSVVLKDAGSLVLQVLNSGQTAGVVLDAATDGVAKFRLRGNAAFATLQGKLTTDTAYTATVVVPTGFLTLYDSTGTAYRVPCVV